jgi:hypothetical protein
LNLTGPRWRLQILSRSGLEQHALGVAHHDEAAGARLPAELERSKWLLWHGNQHRAREAIEILENDVDELEVD